MSRITEQPDIEQAMSLIGRNHLEIRYGIDEDGASQLQLTAVGLTAKRLYAFLVEQKEEMARLQDVIDEEAMPNIPEAAYCFALGQFAGAQRVLSDLYIHLEDNNG